MENINTPVASAEQTNYAGFWRRFAAYYIDGIVINVATLPFLFMFIRHSGVWNFIELSRVVPPGLASFLGAQDAMSYAIIIQNLMKEIMYYALWQGLLILLYFSFWESSKFQATPGKLAVRIKVIGANGERITFLRALARNLSKVISWAIFALGFLMVAFTKKKKGLHDMIADTRVAESEPSYDPTEHLAYAGFWRRFVAFILDSVLIYVLLSPVRFIFMPAYFNDLSKHFGHYMTSDDRLPIPPINDLITISVLSLFSALFAYLYFAIWESSKYQATPGKTALGIKVSDVHGNRLSFWHASGRYINKHISNLTFLIGYMMAGWTSHKQALHDELSNCLVIRNIQS